jgi:hypothetical protein
LHSGNKKIDVIIISEEEEAASVPINVMNPKEE